MKFIFVTGGVMSGIGKGIAAASLGRLLKGLGVSVTCIKVDPYLNIDAGTMGPYQHGEVWVTEDGGEIDMDLGHYERFLSQDIPREHNITSGQIYQSIIEKERRGEYLGQTVQIIPHFTDEVKRRLRSIGERSKSEVVIVEIGGTVGDIESLPMLEVARQVGTENGVLFVHVTLVPESNTGEQKTKPTQHSVATLREVGVQPDVIIARSETPLSEDAKRKIALFCNVPPGQVISGHNVDNVYRLPLVYEEQGLGRLLQEKLRLRAKAHRMGEWRRVVEQMDGARQRVVIAMAGKYVENTDSYISLNEALKHAAASLGARVEIRYVDTEQFEENPEAVENLRGARGVLVPGGFGSRGTEGKLLAIRYARERRLPYLGLCFGFQLATIEFARNVAGLKRAHSTEIDPKTPYPVVDILSHLRDVKSLGGTMRLGAQPIKLRPHTRVHHIYKGQEVILERHRHRYEINPRFIPRLEDKGLVFSGVSPDGRMEVLELPQHPFYMATQFHPEFKSRPGHPAPVLRAFLEAASHTRAPVKEN
ncbi:MAG: CTP synthase [Euryarchaeota archaeon]|nr:CTP synthase [Euryarchaeota archaeon]